MRQIKFRANIKDSSLWIYGYYFKHTKRTPCVIGDELKEEDYLHCICTSGFSDWNMPKPMEVTEIIPNTLGQYIGLKDCNGKGIYEGDTVRCYGGEFCCGWQYDKTIIVCFDLETLQELSYAENCEVIGNIHENPELLGAG